MTMLVHWYLQDDANKVPVLISNQSLMFLRSIELTGRNKQHLFLGDVQAGQTRQVFCDCRNVDVKSQDTVGLLLTFASGNKAT